MTWQSLHAAHECTSVLLVLSLGSLSLLFCASFETLPAICGAEHTITDLIALRWRYEEILSENTQKRVGGYAQEDGWKAHLCN